MDEKVDSTTFAFPKFFAFLNIVLLKFFRC